jgi:hypothetical protein
MMKNFPNCELWSDRDIVYLGQLYSAGIPVEHIAKFLMRGVAQVAEKAASLSMNCGILRSDRRIQTRLASVT